MKLKFLYRLDKNNKPIPASNIRRKSIPLTNRWKEIKNVCCVTPDVVPCSCGMRYFVQIDSQGNPVDHTLIKRALKPRPENGIKYMEISWEDPCCA